MKNKRGKKAHNNMGKQILLAVQKHTGIKVWLCSEAIRGQPSVELIPGTSIWFIQEKKLDTIIISAVLNRGKSCKRAKSLVIKKHRNVSCERMSRFTEHKIHSKEMCLCPESKSYIAGLGNRMQTQKEKKSLLGSKEPEKITDLVNSPRAGKTK